MTMEQIERIRLMESYLDEAEQAVNDMQEALDKYVAAQGLLSELNNYLGSEEWNQDYDDDAAGRLPADLKRGVLSQDGVWNVLDDSRQLNIRMLETLASFLKNN